MNRVYRSGNAGTVKQTSQPRSGMMRYEGSVEEAIRLYRNAPEHLSSHHVLHLQRVIGNRRLARLLDARKPKADANPPIHPTIAAMPAGRALQRRSVPRPKSAKGKVIRRIGTFSGMTVYYTKRPDKGMFYIEAYEKAGKSSAEVGSVNIMPGNPTVLHTHSDEQGGRGSILVGVAIRVIAKYHAKDDSGSVQLPMGGGAVVKLMVSKLSQAFGDRKIHASAERMRKIRQMTPNRDQGSSGERDLDRFDPQFLPEHLLHMKAIQEGKYKHQLRMDSPLGQIDDHAPTDLGTSVNLGEDYQQQLLRAAKLTVTIPNRLFKKFAKSIR